MIDFDDFKQMLIAIGQQDNTQKYRQTERFYKTLAYYGHEYKDFVSRLFEDYSSSNINSIATLINTLSNFYPFCPDLVNALLEAWYKNDKSAFHQYMREKNFERIIIFPFDDSSKPNNNEYSKQKQSELQKEIAKASKKLSERERELTNLERQKQTSLPKINDRMKKIEELEQKKRKLMELYSDEMVQQTEAKKHESLKLEKLFNSANHTELEALMLSRSGYSDNTEDYKRLQKIFEKYRQEN
jgi:ribosome-binding ATPase YchF (GTP1/OBG family)